MRNLLEHRFSMEDLVSIAVLDYFFVMLGKEVRHGFFQT